MRNMHSNSRAARRARTLVGVALALLAASCGGVRFQALRGTNTAGPGEATERSLRLVDTPDTMSGAAGVATTAVDVGSYVRVVVDSVCYPSIRGRVVRRGQSPYFVGSLLVTAPGDHDNPAAVHAQIEQTFAEQVLEASVSGDHLALPPSLVKLQVASDRCVPQEDLASLPVAVQGSAQRHQPHVTFSALWLRALRSHDVERKVGWAINIGRALAGVAGVDIPELDDVRGLGDVQRATETLRSVVGEIEALRAQAETIMLARFVVPLAQPTAAGTSQVLVPSPEQDFVYVWAPGDATEASVVAAQVREGRLHQIEDRVYRVDPALGCSAGETSCPFHGAYLLWHVEASNNQHFTRAAWAEIGTAADAVAGGEVPNLGAFGALMTQGSLRDRVSQRERQLLGRLAGVLGRAANAIHPRAGELVESPCEALDELTALGLGTAADAGVDTEGVPGPVLDQVRSVSSRLRELCGEAACRVATHIRDDSTGACQPASQCPAGRRQSAETGLCERASNCQAGFIETSERTCVRAGSERVATPVEANTAPVAGDGFTAEALGSECTGGRAAACNMLGRYTRLGYGGAAQDNTRAFALYSQACDANHLPACNNVAYSLAHGIGVTANGPEANAMYERVCLAGDSYACANLATRVRETAPERALSLYTRACDEGVTAACRGLAFMWSAGCATGGSNESMSFCSGVSATERVDIALELYGDACLAGDADACSDAAVLLHQQGGAAAIDRVSGLLYEGCSLGSPNACFSYASLLRSRGRTADADRLTAWACAQESHPDACP